MIGRIIWWVTMFGCALLFWLIGVYAAGLKKPMWFWSGSSVDEASITDVKAYNEENARLWIGYSLWYWAAGVLWIWNNGAGLAALIAGCSVGIAILIGTFQRIEKKYKKTGL